MDLHPPLQRESEYDDARLKRLDYHKSLAPLPKECFYQDRMLTGTRIFLNCKQRRAIESKESDIYLGDVGILSPHPLIIVNNTFTKLQSYTHLYTFSL
ncbi:hypothetical protein L6452_14467 [Arctium lappa]|uniref:Uncharacterized protein n=1 Tax=Arctium lappa TaxID=4217 RepID=A0ACB9CL72_ARCLA|nr:hypothetical protein L6452_14467 [Arctium lappa]